MSEFWDGLVNGGKKTVDTLARNRLAQLTSALSVTAGGYTLLSNPQGFILYVVLDAAVGLVQGLAAAVGFRAAQLWRRLGNILVGTFGSALGEPGRDIARLIIDAIQTVDGAIQTAASQAGPFGLLAAFVAWLLVMLAVVYGAVGAWQLYKWLRVVVV